MDIIGALASLAPVTETGSSEAHQNPTTNVLKQRQHKVVNVLALTELLSNYTV
jgi:hypothetical protein